MQARSAKGSEEGEDRLRVEIVGKRLDSREMN